MIKIGIQGAGQVGKRHADAIAKIDNAQLVAVADLDESRAREVALPHGAAFMTDYHEIYALDLDAIINCLPHDLHHESSLLAADRQLHLLLEKPICLTLAEARDVIEAYERKGVKLMTGYVHRYRQEMLDAKALIDAGQLGQVVTAADNFCSSGGSHVPQWVWKKARSGGGVHMYGGIHAVDRLRWFLGSEVRTVYAKMRTYSAPMDVEDGLVAFLEFEDGALASLVQNSPRYASVGGWRTELFGSVGNLVINFSKSLEFSSNSNRFVRTYERYDHFERQMREFVSAIEEDREPWVTGRDGLLSLAVVLAVYESARINKPVELSELLNGTV
jgi:predicted dehydrogenase